MDYKTILKAHAARRAKILALADRKGASVAARIFKVSRQRVYQLRAEESARLTKVNGAI